jgi:hypothetical protein
MAGKLIVDTIDTDNAFITLNVQQATVATINASGILSNTGAIMIRANGTFSNTALTGVITASQLATSLNLATNNVQVASIQTATGTPAITFAANGQITTANAPFILTGGQLQFPATQLASSDANTLDDYEEGTWTPSLGTGSGSPVFTYNYRGGTYVKIGRQVIVWFFADITVTSAGAASPGFNTSSLPIAPRSNSGLTGSSGTNGGFLTNNGNGNNSVISAFFNLVNPASADFVYFSTVTKTGGATGLATGVYGGYLFYEAN